MTIYKGQIPIAGLASPIAPTKSMGQIVESKIPLIDAGLHLLDGTLVRGDGVYKAFVDKIAELYALDPTAEYFCTQEDWEDSVFNYGVCEKFVYDSTYNTVRLPKMYSNIRYLIKSYDDGTNWYRIYSDGWCEQGGFISIPYDNTVTTVTLLKPFANTNYSVISTANPSSVDWVDMANCQITAKTTSSFGITDNVRNSNLANWRASGYTDISNYKKAPNYLYIVLATASKNQEDLDVDMVMTELNGKVNVSDLVSAHVVVEAYSNGTSWYRLYDDGWCEQGGTVNVTQLGTSINLLKTFTSTNYQLAFAMLDSSGDASLVAVAWRSKSTSSFIVDTGFNGTYYGGSLDWQARGYIDPSL